MKLMAGVAQLVEPLTVDQVVAGSSPVSRPIEIEDNASVAQLDRASDFGSEGRGFKSFRAHIPSLGKFSILFLLLLSSFLASFGSLWAQTAQLHNTSGLAKFYQGKYREAFREFVKALRKDPSYAAPHYNLGRLYEKQQRFEEALKQYQQCLQLDPRHQGAQRAVQRLGYLVTPQRDEAPAPSTVREAKRANLERMKKVIGRLIVDGKLDKAEERLLLLLRAHPRDGELHNALARVYERKGSFSKAIAELRKAEKYLPDSSVVVYRLASNLYRVGSFSEAESKARRVIDMDPANYRAYHLLGLIYRSRDDLPQAKKYFAEAARLNPSDSESQKELQKVSDNVSLYHFNSGLYYFTQRNWNKAKEELEKALEGGTLNPGQIAIAQQYLLISDFSSKRIDEELKRIEADRRNAERGFVEKELSFEEVEKSPHIWRKGAHVRFVGILVSVDRDRKGIICDTSFDEESESSYKREAEMDTWFYVEFSRSLPDDPRISDGAEVEIEGKLAKPRFLRNVYNKLYSREPQPVVECTYLTVRNEDELSGPLKIDFLAYSEQQIGQKREGRESRWRRYQYR